MGAKEVKSESVDVVILCGGRGTRLGALCDKTPKPLLPVGGKPFLLYLIRSLQEEGFRRFILAAHYLPDQFHAFLSAYQSLLSDVELIVEPKALGTGGGLRYATERVCSETFVAMNGDCWIAQPLLHALRDHIRSSADFTAVVIKASQVEGGALNKGLWQLGPQQALIDFETKEDVEEGWVNAGTYVLEKKMVSSWPGGSYSLEENFSILLKSKKAIACCSESRLIDIGTSQVYERAQSLLAE
jgi:D-glycero-alpha-D-manno-heptose 1-phosphate guanylyltransferase